MADQISLQADLGSTSNTALGILGSAKPFLQALSSDNIDPLAVLQIEAIGNCFISNGKWASELPDLLARASSIRLERLSAWVGWNKGDTASYLSKTSGGRSVALICLSLANLYPANKCGLVLHNLSCSILPRDKQNTSIPHLSTINTYLAGKLANLGFGNLLATQLTHIRQCFFEAGNNIPTDLATVPTEETMETFLTLLHRALQTDDLVLHFSGSRAAGSFIAMVMCLCPDDVRVDVEGELMYQGQRECITFSILYCDTDTTYFKLESKLNTHSEDFQRRYVHTADDYSHKSNLLFHWSGWLSSCLSIALADVGASSSNTVMSATANLISTSLAVSEGKDFATDTVLKEKLLMPLHGIRSWLGAEWKHNISSTLRSILIEPDNSDDIGVGHRFLALKDSVQACFPLRNCTCGICLVEEPWTIIHRSGGPGRAASKMWNSCKYVSLWRKLAAIINFGLCSPLIELHGNPSIGYIEDSYSILTSQPIWCILSHLCREQIITTEPYYNVGPSDFHETVMSIIRINGRHRVGYLCVSSNSATIFPANLQYPSISAPWTTKYILVDGKLYDGTSVFSGIATPNRMLTRNKLPRRPIASKTLAVKHFPSGLGVHKRLDMMIRPESTDRHSILFLRSVVHLSTTKNIEVDFLDVHIGSMSLSVATECHHHQRSSIADKAVVMTSVAAPLAKKNCIAVTLTHWHSEAQFLCCVRGIRSLYQVGCCLPCAVNQARAESLNLVIGGTC